METMKRIVFNKDPGKFIGGVIAKFVQESPANRRKVDGGKYWETPLVGFASGDNPLFRQYKEIIGEFHYTPQEIFELTFGGGSPPKSFQLSLGFSQPLKISEKAIAKRPSILPCSGLMPGISVNNSTSNFEITLSPY